VAVDVAKAKLFAREVRDSPEAKAAMSSHEQAEASLEELKNGERGPHYVKELNKAEAEVEKALESVMKQNDKIKASKNSLVTQEGRLKALDPSHPVMEFAFFKMNQEYIDELEAKRKMFSFRRDAHKGRMNLVEKDMDSGCSSDERDLMDTELDIGGAFTDMAPAFLTARLSSPTPENASLVDSRGSGGGGGECDEEDDEEDSGFSPLKTMRAVLPAALTARFASPDETDPTASAEEAPADIAPAEEEKEALPEPDPFPEVPEEDEGGGFMEQAALSVRGRLTHRMSARERGELKVPSSSTPRNVGADLEAMLAETEESEEKQEESGFFGQIGLFSLKLVDGVKDGAITVLNILPGVNIEKDSPEEGGTRITPRQTELTPRLGEQEEDFVLATQRWIKRVVPGFSESPDNNADHEEQWRREMEEEKQRDEARGVARDTWARATSRGTPRVLSTHRWAASEDLFEGSEKAENKCPAVPPRESQTAATAR